MSRALALLLLSSCASPPPPAAPTPEPPATKAEVVELLSALEAGFHLHWGAVEGTPEFRRVRRAHEPFLRAIVDANEPEALMAMRVLARRAPQMRFSEDARAIVYVTALQRERNFLRWGAISGTGFLPGVYGEELAGLKPAAVPFLRKLLSDRRRAPVEGGEAGRANGRQGDRVCDYAWILLAAILERPFKYAEDPRDRDDAIRAFDLALDRPR